MNIICTFYIKPLCSGIIVDLNVFSATVSKQKTAHKAVIDQNMHISRSNHAIYLRWHATFPCTTLEKVTIAHSACEKSIRFSIPINTDHLFVNASLPKPKYEPSRHSVAYYRCILLPNVLGIRIPRGQAVVYANCWVSDEICRPCYHAFFRTVRNYLTLTTNANYRCTHLNECTSYRYTSFTYRPLWIHLKFDSIIKVRIITTKRIVITHFGVRAFQTRWHQRHKHATHLIQ